MILRQIEANRESAKIQVDEEHLFIRNLEKGLYPSLAELIRDVKHALRHAGDFFPHKDRSDHAMCIYENLAGELFCFPFFIKR